VYYWRNNREHCIACDQYATKRENLRAVGMVVAALRAIERHGGAYLLEQAARAFELLELPAPSAPWHEVLGVNPSSPASVVRAAYRALVAETHPDAPTGSDEAFRRVKQAFEEWEREVAA
jgi:DnaJ-domain-containing protein 1